MPRRKIERAFRLAMAGKIERANVVFCPQRFDEVVIHTRSVTVRMRDENFLRACGINLDIREFQTAKIKILSLHRAIVQI